MILVTLILAGLATAKYAAASEEQLDLLQPDEMHFFDPFLLRSIPATRTVNADPDTVNSNEIVTLDELNAVRIPTRPALRSPYKPSRS